MHCLIVSSLGKGLFVRHALMMKRAPLPDASSGAYRSQPHLPLSVPRPKDGSLQQESQPVAWVLPAKGKNPDMFRRPEPLPSSNWDSSSRTSPTGEWVGYMLLCGDMSNAGLCSPHTWPGIRSMGSLAASCSLVVPEDVVLCCLCVLQGALRAVPIAKLKPPLRESYLSRVFSR